MFFSSVACKCFGGVETDGFTHGTVFFALYPCQVWKNLMGFHKNGRARYMSFFCSLSLVKVWKPMGSQTEPFRGAASPVCLVLAPTRELCHQIHDDAVRFAYGANFRIAMVYGGQCTKEILFTLVKLESGQVVF